MIIAIAVILFVLGGLYLKNSKLSPSPTSKPTVEAPTPLSSPAEEAPGN